MRLSLCDWHARGRVICIHILVSHVNGLISYHLVKFTCVLIPVLCGCSLLCFINTSLLFCEVVDLCEDFFQSFFLLFMVLFLMLMVGQLKAKHHHVSVMVKRESTRNNMLHQFHQVCRSDNIGHKQFASILKFQVISAIKHITCIFFLVLLCTLINSVSTCSHCCYSISTNIASLKLMQTLKSNKISISMRPCIFTLNKMLADIHYTW